MRKKITILTAALALLAMLAVPKGGWGQTTSELTLSSSKKFGTTSGSTLLTETTPAITWTVTKTSGSGEIQNSYQTAYHGQQFGTGSASWGGTFSATYNNTVTSVKVDANTGGAATLSVTVGGIAFTCGTLTTVNVTKNSSSTGPNYYEFTGNGTGNIVISLTGTSKACYFGGVVVTYSAGPSITITGDGISNNAVSLNWNNTADHTATVNYTNLDERVTELCLYETYENDELSDKVTDISNYWLMAVFGVNDDEEITYAATSENASVNPHTVYMRVEAMGSDEEYYYSNVIAITQAGKPTYTVNYNCDGGEGCPTEPVIGIVHGNSITLASAPSKTGYTFGGWNDGNTTYAAGASYTVTSNVTLTAQWTVNTYGYILNITGEDSHAEAALYVGGNELQANDVIDYGTEVTVSVIPDDFYGYSISVKDAGNNTVSFDETNSTFIMPASAVTITVNITEIPTWIVTFSTNGVEHGTIRVARNQAIQTLLEPATDYIPAGYTFMGWIEGNYPVSDDAPTGYIEVPYTPEGNVTLNAVFAEVSGSSSTGTLTKTEIQSNITNEAHSYSNDPASYTDTEDNITWTVKGNWTAGRPWMQIRSNDIPSYIKVQASTNISSVTVTISNASNTTGGQDDITKHGAFTGEIYLNTEENGSTHDGSTNTIVDNVATIVSSTGSYSTLYLQVSGPARIWGVTVTCGSVSYSNYRTSYSESYQMTIAQHGGTTADGGWYLIASPVASVTPTADNGFITTVQDDYDLYRFDQNAELEWENYKATSSSLHPDFIALVNGRGYLYANGEAEGTTLTFEGAPYNGNGEVQLYNVEGAELAGWNLIGNPFGTPATIGTKPYYRMNYTYDNGVIVGGGNELEAATGIIAPMEGIFVHVSQDSTLTFNHATTSAPAVGMVAINILQEAQRGASQTIDRAIVRFGENGTLPKFQLNPNHTKVYIPQDGKDYAVVGADNEGEMPVNFRAAKNGTYTLTVNPEGVEMNYLHLIDNMTGNDVDLLATPSYTFNATTRDYESRFRLVFAANNENGVSAGSTTFAYFSNGNLVVNNEGNATLQVVDVMGRIVKSESINGSASINVNAAPGVYTLRLVNGNDVKTQKVVVR